MLSILCKRKLRCFISKAHDAVHQQFESSGVTLAIAKLKHALPQINDPISFHYNRSFIYCINQFNASDERVAERRQRQSEGTDALWARGLLRKTRDQHRRSARSHS